LYKAGSFVIILFILTQHIRDELLLKSFKSFFECGHTYFYLNYIEFRCQSFKDNYERILPFFQKYLILKIFYSLFFILYSLFFILYSLFFILYSLFFILYSLFFILGEKSKDFEDWIKVAKMIQSKEHLISEDFKEIRKIKANINKGRYS
jgi:LAGLIDADG endonuclease